VLNSLHKLDRLAQRLARKYLSADAPTWTDTRQTLEDWVKHGPKNESRVSQLRSIIIAHGHGDMNHHNILWSDNYKRPFLIDFATFRTDANLVHDFAMMETQLLFMLMDQESESTLPELDHSSLQWAKWIARIPELYPHGKSANQFTPFTSHEPEMSGIQLAEQLVQIVRCNAARIFAKASEGKMNEQDFDDDYCSALLLETLRTITYQDGVSLFKRILAAFVAARLILRFA
jgi:hypothetical protein